MILIIPYNLAKAFALTPDKLAARIGNALLYAAVLILVMSEDGTSNVYKNGITGEVGHADAAKTAQLIGIAYTAMFERAE